jgi:hypothetical protein
VKRRRDCMDPVCVRCGGVNDRVPQSYCAPCHRAYVAARRRTVVEIPEEMVTAEQRAWLERQRPGRRRSVSREPIRIREIS